jgi:hypothetical protein
MGGPLRRRRRYVLYYYTRTIPIYILNIYIYRDGRRVKEIKMLGSINLGINILFFARLFLVDIYVFPHCSAETRQAQRAKQRLVEIPLLFIYLFFSSFLFLCIYIRIYIYVCMLCIYKCVTKELTTFSWNSRADSRYAKESSTPLSRYRRRRVDRKKMRIIYRPFLAHPRCLTVYLVVRFNRSINIYIYIYNMQYAYVFIAQSQKKIRSPSRWPQVGTHQHSRSVCSDRIKS